MHSRRSFLSASASAASILAVTVSAAAQNATPSPHPEPSFPPLQFDTGAFDATLNGPAAHKHLYASAKLNEGLILDAMRGTLGAYRDLGVSFKDVQLVAVLYHGSTFLGFDDRIWDRFFIPAMHPKDQKSAGDFEKDFNSVYDGKTPGNPCLHKTGKPDDTSIESLVADAGARFFVCNNATKGFAAYMARKLKLNATDVYAEMATHLVPNAMLVPAGVWAVHSIQEHKYTYMQATL